VVRLGLHRVDQIRKLHRILDEEHRDVVADEIPVAFVRIELDGEPAHVTRRVGGTALAGHRRKAHEHRRALAGLGKDRCPRQLCQRFVALEEAVGARAPGMHDALGNALMVEVRDLFPEDEIFQQRGSAQAGLERVLVVRNRHTLIRRQCSSAGIDSRAIERTVAGIETQRWIAFADLQRCIGLGERASADRWSRRLDGLSACGCSGSSAKLGGFCGIERKCCRKQLSADQLLRRRIRSRVGPGLLGRTAGRGTSGCLRHFLCRTTVAGQPAHAGCRAGRRTFAFGHD
jgi:hypothetical protein